MIGLLTACGKANSRPATAEQRFEGRGLVVEAPVGNTVVIKHEAISNYMTAMTMPFEDRDSNGLRDISAGDTVSFQLVVTATNGWIERVVKLN
jgi:Cu/Ag efflux protein CusF